MGVSTNSFLLSAADVNWGRRNRSCVTTVADVAGNLGGTYFEIDTIDSSGAAVLNYVWFDTGADADPTPVGRTGIEITISANDTAALVASAMQAILEGESNYRAKVSASNSALVVIDNEFVGTVSNVTADVDTLFAFETNVEGVGGSLGSTSGGVEVTIETGSVPITTDQTGGSDGVVVDEVILGQKVSCSMTLIEMTPDKWKTVVGSVTGDTHTPAGGTEMTGYGVSRNYQSLLDLGGQLVLHPTRKDASDRTLDITFWKCAPKPSSINFSPDEVQGMELEFTAYADPEVVEAIRIMAQGDNQQDVRV